MNEEIEYIWERIDSKSKQKYYRFFYFISKLRYELTLSSAIYLMGWRKKCTNK